MISVDNDIVSKVGTEIIEQNEAFIIEIQKFVNIVENINTAWEGADALVYINLLRDKYAPKLMGLSDVIKEYGIYLNDVVEAYSLLDEIFASKNINV